jgi:hypothetical protein
VRDGSRRATALYGGFTGIAIYVAIQQVAAPVYNDVQAYEPRAAGYEFRRDVDWERELLATWKTNDGLELDASRLRVFVASSGGRDLGLVAAEDTQTTRLTDNDLRQAVQNFVGAETAGGKEVSPIAVGPREVLV